MLAAKIAVQTPGQGSKRKYEKKIFLQRFALSRFLEKIKTANKIIMKNLLKNLSFGGTFKL